MQSRRRVSEHHAPSKRDPTEVSGKRVDGGRSTAMTGGGLPIPMDPEAQPAESLRPLVAALRELLKTAGPEALPFLRDWPRELTPRPQ